MKKLLFLLLVVLTGHVMAQSAGPAPEFKAVSFFGSDVASLVVSNTIGLTNLTFTDGSLKVNPARLSWTNVAGTVYTVTSSAYTNVNLCRNVPLWSLRDGSGAWRYLLDSTNVTSKQVSEASIAVTVVGGANSTNGITCVVSPVYDGRYGSTATGDDFTFVVTPNGATTVTISTNLPLWKWPGAGYLTIKNLVPGATDASGQTTIKAFELIGFQVH